MKDIVLEFLSKSDENYRLYEHLSKENVFVGWQVVALFYSALCYVKAYFYSKNINENSINTHNSIKSLLNIETNAKLNNVLRYYEPLYRDSRDARYTQKKITETRVQRCIDNFKKVKELLKIPT